MSTSMPNLVKWFKGRSKKAKVEPNQASKTTLDGSHRSGRLLPPIPRDFNRSPFHRSSANSPAHIYEEIPLHLVQSSFSDPNHNVDLDNLDFSSAKEYGCYLIVPLKDRFDQDPRFRESLTSRVLADRRRHPIFGLNSNVPSPAPSEYAPRAPVSETCDDDYLESVCSSLHLDTSSEGRCQNCCGSIHRPRSNLSSSRYHSIATLDLLKFKDSEGEDSKCESKESSDENKIKKEKSKKQAWEKMWPSKIPPMWNSCNVMDDFDSPVGNRNVYEDLPISPETSWEADPGLDVPIPVSPDTPTPTQTKKDICAKKKHKEAHCQEGDYAYHLSKARHNLLLKEEVIRYIKLSESSEGETTDIGENFHSVDNCDTLTNVTALSDRSLGSSMTLSPGAQYPDLDMSYMEIHDIDDLQLHEIPSETPLPVESDDLFEYYEVQDVPQLKQSKNTLSRSHGKYIKSGHRNSFSSDQSLYEEPDRLSCRVSNIVPAYKIYRPLYSVMYNTPESSLYSKGSQSASGISKDQNTLLGDLLRHNNDRQILTTH